MICGIDVTLYEVTQDGVDDFNKPILEETPVTVPNVVVAPASSTDVLSTTQIYGKKAVYQLFIPKGDAHQWEDRIVSFTVSNVFFKGRVFGYMDAYIESMVPLEWNQRVWVGQYE